MKPFAACLILPFLPILLASCGVTPRTETIRLTPPANLTTPCKASDPRPETPTIRDLVESRAIYREALAECDARMGAIREWAEP